MRIKEDVTGSGWLRVAGLIMGDAGASVSVTTVFASYIVSTRNNIGKVYSLEYSGIQKVFFTPHHIGLC